MPVSSQIVDGTGDGFAAAVNAQNALRTNAIPLTSRGFSASDLANLRQLREFLRDESGSINLNADGSTTPIEFSLEAIEGVTRWVTGVRLIFEGGNLEISTNDFRRFGTAATSPGLTNGVEIETEQQGQTVTITKAPVVTIGDFLTYSNAYLNLANSVAAGTDFLRFDFRFDQPIVLVEGSIDRLLIRISDDLTPILKFQAIARGYEESL